MFQKISEIKTIREKIAGLSSIESELSKPTLSDFAHVETIYEWFKELSAKGPKRDNATLRKEFIFIVLYLYSPGALAGGKMKSGLRNKIAEVLGVKAMSAVSNKLDSVSFSYKMYKYFRQDLNRIFEGIQERLDNETL